MGREWENWEHGRGIVRAVNRSGLPSRAAAPQTSVGFVNMWAAEELHSCEERNVQVSAARGLVLDHRVTAPECCMGKTEVSQVPGEPFLYACPALGPRWVTRSSPERTE